jgi:hypothetical protein
MSFFASGLQNRQRANCDKSAQRILIQVYGEAIVVVPSIGVVRKAVLPVHVRDLLLQRRFLPQ